ncbi:hypothetical protein [Nonomuraea sp. NPDC005650]|uniref:hypothetical protein n=1 Tax=Nonomuraea sp. NPDC005650 TaxID=3157045 RepID=UPI0033BEC589
MNKKILLAPATLISGLLIMAAAPDAPAANAAVNPRTHYSLSYGRGEYTLKGNIIWYNRTVQLGASLKANEDNCAKARYKFWHGRTLVGQAERVVCSRTGGHGFRRQYDRRGGITEVTVDLLQKNSGRWTYLTGTSCTRRGCR